MSYAMNTIPTTFNEHAVSYALAGGEAFESKKGGIDAIVISRGGWYNFSSIVESLKTLGISSIISVEAPNKSLDIEKMIVEYPSVKFLLPSEQITVGEGINIAISELKGEFVLTLRNEQSIVDPRLMLKSIKEVQSSKRICTVPVLITKNNSVLNTQMVPILKDGHFFTESASLIQNGGQSIYSFDFSGIYNRSKFIDVGGFDYTITNPYWQNLDFGFRSFLWGEELKLNTKFKLKYLSTLPIEDTSHDDSYTRFYLKNLKPSLKGGKAYMSFDVFFSYVKGMGVNPFMAYKYFKIGRAWVRSNETRFKISPYELIANWSTI